MREHKPMFYDFGIRADWHDRRSCRMPGRLLTGTACNTLSVPTGTLISVPDRIIKRYSTSALARRPNVTGLLHRPGTCAQMHSPMNGSAG